MSDSHKYKTNIVLEYLKKYFNQYFKQKNKINKILEAQKQCLYDKKPIYHNEVLMTAVCELCPNLIEFANSELKKSEEIALICIEKDPISLQYFDNYIKNNEVIQDLAVQKNPQIIQYINYYNQQIETWNTILQIDGLLLQYSTQKIKENSKLVLTAVKQNALSIQYSNINCLNDDLIVLQAVSQNGKAYQYISQRLKSNSEIIEIALKDSQSIFQFIPKNAQFYVNYKYISFQENLPNLIQIQPLLYKELSKIEQQNQKIINLTLQKNPFAIYYMTKLENFEQLYIDLIKQYVGLIQLSSIKISFDYKTLINYDSNLIQYIKYGLEHQKNAIKKLLNQNPFSYQYISENLQQEFELQQLILKQNPYSFQLIKKSVIDVTGNLNFQNNKYLKKSINLENQSNTQYQIIGQKKFLKHNQLFNQSQQQNQQNAIKKLKTFKII